MLAIAPAQFANFVWETRRRLERSQVKFAAKLEVSLRSINHWGNGQTEPLSITLKQNQHWLHPMGEAGQDLLVKYFLE